ncbi:MAG: hypothetical protein R2714_14255 [Microthrixaceae bacterium]
MSDSQTYHQGSRVGTASLPETVTARIHPPERFVDCRVVQLIPGVLDATSFGQFIRARGQLVEVHPDGEALGGSGLPAALDPAREHVEE